MEKGDISSLISVLYTFALHNSTENEFLETLVEKIAATLNTKDSIAKLHINKVNSLSKSLMYMRLFLDITKFEEYEQLATSIFIENF